MLDLHGLSSRRSRFLFLLIAIVAIATTGVGLNQLRTSIGGLANQTIAHRPDPAPDPSEPVQDYERRIGELEAALADARAQITKLEELRARDWQETVHLVESLGRSAQGSENPRLGSAESALSRLEAMFRRRDINDVEALVVELASQGPEALYLLDRTVRDPNVPIEYRKYLFGVATLLPQPRSLELVLAPPHELADTDLLKTQSRFRALARLMRSLRPEQAAVYQSQVSTMAKNSIRGGNDYEETWQLAAILAFEHNDTWCRQLFADADQLEARPRFITSALEWLHTPASRRIVEGYSQAYRGTAVGRQAELVLARW